MMLDRQVVLDTETTGLEVENGHRIIEIGCIELRDRRLTGNDFHRYVNPERAVDAQAAAVHGMTNERLETEPVFEVLASELWAYLEGAELIIHNAAFDVGFLDAEFARVGKHEKLAEVCRITDSVAMARKLHPGQRVNLDALCRRYGIDNSSRELHGALLDARLLAEVYLGMTGGQVAMPLGASTTSHTRQKITGGRAAADKPQVALRVVRADDDELAAHHKRLAAIVETAGKCMWSDELKQDVVPPDS